MTEIDLEFVKKLFIKLTLLTSILYLENKTIKKFEIYKDFKVNCKVKIEKSPTENKKNVILNNDELFKLDKEVRIFYTRITKKLPHINFTCFNSNIKTIEFKEKNIKIYNKIVDFHAAAYYIPKKNTIIHPKNVNRYTLSHELIHMASTYIDNEKQIIYSGFRQTSLKCHTNIGNSLNEGYTELINSRYFKTNHHTKTKYKIEVNICKCLEIIVGKELMENLYFEANLYDLIEYLKQYDNEENIILFLKKMDFITKYLYKSSQNKLKYKLINKFVVDLCNTLDKWNEIKIMKIKEKDYKQYSL